MIFGNKGNNMYTSGNTDFFSDGTRQHHSGNTIFNDNGTASHQSGNTLFTPNGAVHKSGSTFFCTRRTMAYVWKYTIWTKWQNIS